MYCRSVVFTDAPLVKAIRYKDAFQLVPFFYFPQAPFSEYAHHFPYFLEYEVEDKDEVLYNEDELRSNGFSEDVLKLGRNVPNQTRVRKEILHLLTALTNFKFFEYFGGRNCWGVQAPMKSIEELSPDELERLNNQTSHWTFSGYIYPNYAEDFMISSLTDCNNYYEASDGPIEYFTVNCNIDNNSEIKVPPFLSPILDRYYSLDNNEKGIVRQCIGLLYEGISLFDSNRSVSMLSIISSIEGMAKLDLKKYGKGVKLRPTERFLRYLKTYVAGKSEDKYRLYYQKRCEITHDGVLFLSDLDLYGDPQIQDEDWHLRLEVLQAARLAFYNWLRRKER